MKKQTNIIISKKSVASKDLYDIVYSNVTVVNLLLDEGLEETEIHKDALASYYADYYLAQVENGGFSQYVYNTKWKDIVNDRVAYGLEKMGALKHLDYFTKKRAEIDKIPNTKLDTYFDSDYFGENQTRDNLNDAIFINIEENISDLNGTWLKNHKDTNILSIEDMFLAIEKISGTKIER
ncbi:MAG TPA: DUF4375 domain-containing protein [Bacteroidia bacterium]|nr:DUF4375 domain-containing protein [Bacteroidia bacterium]